MRITPSRPAPRACRSGEFSSAARKEFNEVAKTYNVAVRRFPANLVAKLFGFGQKPYFEAAEGTETAPQVQF